MCQELPPICLQTVTHFIDKVFNKYIQQLVYSDAPIKSIWKQHRSSDPKFACLARSVKATFPTISFLERLFILQQATHNKIAESIRILSDLGEYVNMQLASQIREDNHRRLKSIIVRNMPSSECSDTYTRTMHDLEQQHFVTTLVGFYALILFGENILYRPVQFASTSQSRFLRITYITGKINVNALE